MPNILILKLGATGDVVRTTPLLTAMPGEYSWVTAAKNVPLLSALTHPVRAVAWENRAAVCDRTYDLVINLEDTPDVAAFLGQLKYGKLFGAQAGPNGALAYTDDARGWFDLSLISRFGKAEADRLKLANRRTYQELIFSGLGLHFQGEKYLLPEPAKTTLAGDVAIAPKAGSVWPMKNWAYYGELKAALEKRRVVVNVLPERASLLEHLGDVRNHRCLVSGDSLPMHLALGTHTRCVTLFTCTGPWEIHPYGIQRQITSPLLAEFFFKRGMDERAIKAITLDEVLAAVLEQLR
jgi:heptosyltransferase-2